MLAEIRFVKTGDKTQTVTEKSMKQIQRLLGVCLFAFFLGSFYVQAQTASTSAITGTITDLTNGAVPNATVTATNTDNGQSRSVTTAVDGTYNFGLLPPGTYRVTITASGFKTEEVRVT